MTQGVEGRGRKNRDLATAITKPFRTIEAGGGEEGKDELEIRGELPLERISWDGKAPWGRNLPSRITKKL